jgi:LacI family transcriptional regulator
MATQHSPSVTILDVATRAGVSAMTVSRVLNSPELVSAKTKERVEKVISVLGYTPNALARGLKGSTRTLALIIPDISNSFFTHMVHGAEAVAREYNYTLFLGNSDSSLEIQDRYLSKMLSHQIDGLLIVPMGNGSRKTLERVQSRGVPVVLMDAKVPGLKSDQVVGDNRKGGFELTQHLINLGHERIALVSGSQDISTMRERQQGYKQALEHYQLPFEPDYFIRTDFSLKEGYEAVQKLFSLRQPPTALVALSNLLVVGMLQALREAGLRVPEDVAVVCYEDIELASALQPFLTVMAQPAKEFGRIGAEFLLERITNPERKTCSTVLSPSLLIRRSCGSPMSTFV